MNMYLPWSVPVPNRPLLITVNGGNEVAATYMDDAFRFMSTGDRVEGEINWRYVNNDHEDDAN